jgi:hypothetical protein
MFLRLVFCWKGSHMDADLLQQYVAHARADANFFEALANKPESIIPEFAAVDDRLNRALQSGVPVLRVDNALEHGVLQGCNKTSCGCGGSI